MDRLVVVAIAVLFAGCTSFAHGAPAGPTVGPAVVAMPELVLDHDHKDPKVHDQAVGLELEGFLDAKTLLPSENARLSDIQFFGNKSVVVLNGRAGATSGGFFLFDLVSATALKPVARYRSGSEDNWYAKFSVDGNYVFLTANGGTGPAAIEGGVTSDAQAGTVTGPARGIQVIDIRDPLNPKLAWVFASPVRAINIIPWMDKGGGQWLAASITNDRVPRTAGTGSTPSLNYVSLLSFDSSNGQLMEVSRWQPNDAAGVGDAFPHDISVAVDPLNGRTLLFVAYWDAGGYIVDVTDPRSPQTVSHVPSLGGGDHVHTYKPHPYLLDGQYYAVLAPETFAGEPIGSYRLINITDAKHPTVAKTWSPGPAELHNTESLLFSPHEFALDDGRLYASSYHGGAWVVDVPTFTPRAAWLRSVGDPARTNDWAIDIETVVPYHGYVYAVDMNAGVLILHEAGASPNPVAH